MKSHYDYVSSGNRVGGTYDDQDRMIKYGENMYQYSANGELQQKVTPTGSYIANGIKANVKRKAIIKWKYAGINWITTNGILIHLFGMRMVIELSDLESPPTSTVVIYY